MMCSFRVLILFLPSTTGTYWSSLFLKSTPVTVSWHWAVPYLCSTILSLFLVTYSCLYSPFTIIKFMHSYRYTYRAAVKVIVLNLGNKRRQEIGCPVVSSFSLPLIIFIACFFLLYIFLSIQSLAPNQ